MVANHINLLYELQEDKGHMIVITCVDYFSKMVHLVPLQECDARTVADKFLSMIVSQYGLLECILSDYDPCLHGHL